MIIFGKNKLKKNQTIWVKTAYSSLDAGAATAAARPDRPKSSRARVHTKYRKAFLQVFEFVLAEFCVKFLKINAPRILPLLQYLATVIWERKKYLVCRQTAVLPSPLLLFLLTITGFRVHCTYILCPLAVQVAQLVSTGKQKSNENLDRSMRDLI